MAEEEYVTLIRQGPETWNAWRQQNPSVRPELSGVDLHGAKLENLNLRNANLCRADLADADLSSADLGGSFWEADRSGTNLFGADLRGAQVSRARLVGANLRGALLTGATLAYADLSEASLAKANLVGADLRGTNLRCANLQNAMLIDAVLVRTDLFGADVTRIELRETIFGDIDLSGTKGLDTCIHVGPSIIDYRTLQRSGQLPLSFLRGCGLPDNLIEYLPSLFNQTFQFYSCFISYSSKDNEFARRLHADLQNKGIRCWFAPEDMKTGDRIRTRIDEVIRLHEKLLLVLSANSINSDWVEKEVETAFEKERETKSTVLFPIRLDGAVMTSRYGWAADIRRSRHIGDFGHWKDHDGYRKAFDRLLRDLKVEPET